MQASIYLMTCISSPLRDILPLRLNLLLPLGLKEKAPQKLAGILKEPAESDPIPKGVPLIATIGASPPADPPLINSGLYGFLARP